MRVRLDATWRCHGKETQRRAAGKASGIRPHSQAESALGLRPAGRLLISNKNTNKRKSPLNERAKTTPWRIGGDKSYLWRDIRSGSEYRRPRRSGFRRQ
jgi:hypothetical protein